MLNSVPSLDLSVVVVNWNSGPWLARLLNSLRPLKGELRGIVVVDNASCDSSVQAAEGTPGVTLMRCPSNLGFAAAANLGIRSTPAPFVLLLNPDLQVKPEGVRACYRELQNSPGAAICCGRLIDEEGVPQTRFQFRPLPTAVSVIRDALFLDELLAWTGRPHAPLPTPGLSDPTGPAPGQPAAACWLLRRRAWEELGGFDERFHPAWFEDVDFCRRLHDSGWEIRVRPEPCAVHRGGLSLDRLSWPEFVSIYYGNLLRYWRKHHQASLVPVWLAVRLGMALRRLKRRR